MARRRRRSGTRRFIRRRGVPIGYRHNWRYSGAWREKKVGRGKWRFRFKAAKRRSGSASGGLRRGQRLVWKIVGYQVATKIRGRMYLTDFRGTKTLVSSPRFAGRRRRR